MAKKKKTSKKGKQPVSATKRWIVSLLLVIVVICGYTAYNYYQQIFGSNISLGKKESVHFYIKSKDGFNEVVQSLYNQGYILNKESFAWVASQKKYTNNTKPGKYLLRNRMSNNDLINLLRSGNQAPVKVIFNNIRTMPDLAGKIATYLEQDSLSFLAAFTDEQLADSLGFNLKTLPTIFIPNTYEFYWNTSPRMFINRMAKEYKSFWNDQKKAAARKIGLSQSEISILASIVKAETSKKDEAPRVAGVYMNRLKKGIALQADPTLIWAMNDFTITRVLNVHKKIDSPYNTYKFKGLPPGPINLPEPVYLNAVMNYEKHAFLYFCAKPDFSGYHAFASNYTKHLVNARRYQKTLNDRKIFK
ncbi:MAG: UPF0755 protein [Flavobacteriales bacterium]|jgi:UPF0755 protein